MPAQPRIRLCRHRGDLDHGGQGSKAHARAITARVTCHVTDKQTGEPPCGRVAMAMRVSWGLAAASVAARSVRAIPRVGLARTSLPYLSGYARPLHTSVLRLEAPREPVGEVQPRLQLTFTCTVPNCHTRSTHEFSKRSYTQGIVIVECPGCKSRHLIADHLGWFTNSQGEPRTIEEIVRAKGGHVQVGTLYADGSGGATIEIESGQDEGLST